jgi:phosphoserine/homoserine phosphotransferase
VAIGPAVAGSVVGTNLKFSLRVGRRSAPVPPYAGSIRGISEFRVDSAVPRRTGQRCGLLKHCAPVKQSIVTLDMEGVLTPEIWIAVSEKTGIPALRRTTRDEPDYDKLMRYRIEILDKHGIKLSDIQSVIGSLQPLPGGKEFLDELRTQVQVIILSDTFEQFAQPLMRQLNWPTLFCHRLIVSDDRITGYQLRQPNQKQKSVAALRSLNYHVVAAGDSYNDTAMLGEANVGFLIHAPENVKREFPQFAAVESHEELLQAIRTALAQ